jgi:hypothetical protein
MKLKKKQNQLKNTIKRTMVKSNIKKLNEIKKMRTKFDISTKYDKTLRNKIEKKH